MENTPLTPRPRRTDRRTAAPSIEQPPQQAAVYQPGQPAAGAVPPQAQQSAAAPSQSAYDARQAYYRQRPAMATMQQRMNGAEAAPIPRPAQLQPQRPVQVQQPAPRNSTMQQPAQVQRPAAAGASRTPRALQQRADAYARWQMPGEDAAAPTAADTPAEAGARKLPGWLTTALCVMLVTVMALVATIALMQSFLKRDADARQAAYEAILTNYHVTEQADGTLRVTWQDEIEHYAAQYNLQPAFVTAIIRNESSFRTAAESGVGARGLMQLMPDTAEWIAGKLDDDNYSFDDMYDAETNIRYGCWYLGYLNKLFRGDAVLVSAAYHAGQTQVTRWLSDSSISPDGITIPLENMTDGPTKQYAGRVTQAYGIYQSLLYPEEAAE